MQVQESTRRAGLIILDGWGLAPPGPGNAVAQANTPVFDALWSGQPHTTLRTSGLDVGLPEGQMGNSEVGHLNLGAGFVVYQSITRIDVAMADGTFASNPALIAACDAAAQSGTLHLLGLVSEGGVHSHQRHLAALLQLAAQRGCTRVAIHAILDGRDAAPHGGVANLQQLQRDIAAAGVGEIVSVIGRYWAMDRDRRWERIARAVDLLTQGLGTVVSDPIAAVERGYAAGVTDEFMEPLSVHADAAAPTVIAAGDQVIFFNFRSDRARQLSMALTGSPDAAEAHALQPGMITLTTMTEYMHDLPAQVAFSAIDVRHPLARVVAEAGLAQVHVAETEKYAHVTYFLNGGREEPFRGESRVLVPSPKVPTYDLQPEMSAAGVGDAAVAALERPDIALLVVNFANCDMVGHTGDLAATVRAVEAVDAQLGRVVAAARAHGVALLITADHGNSETMLTPDGAPMTAHTTNPVPCVLLPTPQLGPVGLRNGGRLADVAPTLLHLLHVAPAADMDGHSLLLAPGD